MKGLDEPNEDARSPRQLKRTDTAISRRREAESGRPPSHGRRCQHLGEAEGRESDRQQRGEHPFAHATFFTVVWLPLGASAPSLLAMARLITSPSPAFGHRLPPIDRLPFVF
jgi:hypothetical protein